MADPDIDAEVCDLLPQCQSEGLDSGLAGVVRRHPGERRERGEGRHDQHVATALDQVRQGRVHGTEDTGEVDVDGAREGVRIDLADGAVRRDTGVGDHHVDTAEVLDCVRDCLV